MLINKHFIIVENLISVNGNQAFALNFWNPDLFFPEYNIWKKKDYSFCYVFQKFYWG